MGLGSALNFASSESSDVVSVVNSFEMLLERIRLQKKQLEEVLSEYRVSQIESSASASSSNRDGSRDVAELPNVATITGEAAVVSAAAASQRSNQLCSIASRFNRETNLDGKAI